VFVQSTGETALAFGNSVFDLKHVSYRYRPHEPALLDISLTVGEGEKIVILGPNGAGKTTLEKILAGILVAEGRFTAFGKPLTMQEIQSKTESAAYRRRVGAVFQNIEFRVICATVYDEILFGPQRLGLPRDEAQQRVEQMLDFCNIRRLANRLPQNMSGGEKKIVAIASMLAENPEVMIFDEPTNDLDLESQNWLVSALQQLNAAGKTVITATHSLETARELADRVWIFGGNHRLIADGGIELLQDSSVLTEAGILR
jgi:cobalt/nickel transport system ATP-binding protein